jgi:hypothetical protein
MPVPLLGILAGAVGTKVLSKEEKKIPVSGRIKKDGTRSKAHLRKKRK